MSVNYEISVGHGWIITPHTQQQTWLFIHTPPEDVVKSSLRAAYPGPTHPRHTNDFQTHMSNPTQQTNLHKTSSCNPNDLFNSSISIYSIQIRKWSQYPCYSRRAYTSQRKSQMSSRFGLHAFFIIFVRGCQFELKQNLVEEEAVIEFDVMRWCRWQWWYRVFPIRYVRGFTVRVMFLLHRISWWIHVISLYFVNY